MVCGIYSITNHNQNKRYIGQSTNIQKRLSGHKRLLRKGVHANKRMLKDYQKDKDLFTFDIVECCKPRYLDRLEKLYVKKYQSNNEKYGYNLFSGGKQPTKEDYIIASKNRTRTGIYRVHKHKDQIVKQGFRWRYQYYDKNKELVQIQSLNLYDLKQHVKQQGLFWKELTIKGKQLVEEQKREYNPYSNYKNPNGYYRVSKKYDPKYKQGFIWTYQFHRNGKHVKISSVDIDKLKEKVVGRGLEWYEIGGEQ